MSIYKSALLFSKNINNHACACVHEISCLFHCKQMECWNIYSNKFTFPIRGLSFDIIRLFRICETAPQHFNVLATSSSLSRYSSSVSGKDFWELKKIECASDDICKIRFRISNKHWRIHFHNLWLKMVWSFHQFLDAAY